MAAVSRYTAHTRKTKFSTPVGDGPSRTKQSFKNECDINNIVKKAAKTGELPLSQRKPLYSDVAEVPDFQTALNIVQQASDKFAGLPSRIRDRFGNDPSQLMAFIKQPNNADEAAALGFFKKEAVERVESAKKKVAAEKHQQAPKGEQK